MSFVTAASPSTKMPNATFWADFVKSHWEKEPLTCAAGFMTPPIESNDLFEIVAKDCMPELERSAAFKFFLDGTFLEPREAMDAGYYPRLADESFAGYDERVRELIDGRDYMLAIDCMSLNQTLWDWTMRFLADLTAELGYLNTNHFFSVFYGPYRGTAFGVHNHPNPPESAFYFPIEGEKGMRVWQPAYVNQHASMKMAGQYKDHLKHSQLLRAGRGGMLYWPSDHYHIGEDSSGNVSTVLAMNNDHNFYIPLHLELFAYAQQRQDNALDQLLGKRAFLKRGHAIHYRQVWQADLIGTKATDPSLLWKRFKVWRANRTIRDDAAADLRATFNPQDRQQSAADIPDAIRFAASVFEGHVDATVLDHCQTALWLKMLTGGGIRPGAFPMHDTPSLKQGDYLTRRSVLPILWRRVAGDRMGVSANGFVKFPPYSEGMVKVIERLNAGEPCQVIDLVNAAEDADGANDIGQILEHLVSFRAIEQERKA